MADLGGDKMTRTCTLALGACMTLNIGTVKQHAFAARCDLHGDSREEWDRRNRRDGTEAPGKPARRAGIRTSSQRAGPLRCKWGEFPRGCRLGRAVRAHQCHWIRWPDVHPRHRSRRTKAQTFDGNPSAYSSMTFITDEHASRRPPYLDLDHVEVLSKARKVRSSATMPSPALSSIGAFRRRAR